MEEITKIVEIDENKYENIYQFNTNCIYNTEHLKFIELTDKTFINDDTTLKLVEKNLNNILNKYTNEELITIHQRIVPIEKIKRDILMYSFMYGTPDVVSANETDVFNLLLDQLNLYQWTVGGFNIEDKEWIECTENTRFKPNLKQRAIYNSLESYNNDQELKWFLKNILRRVSSSIKTNIGIKIYYKIMEDKSNEISWVTIVIEKTENKKFE